MTKFTWNKWLGNVLPVRGARKARRASVAQIEGLENRALLTANLPVAVADTYTVDQDTTLNATPSVLANDTDADSDTISQAILQNNVTNGSLTLNSNGTFTYVPTAGFNGTDSFTYFAKDVTNNEVSANAATVTINVAANNAPVVSAVNLSTAVDTPLTGTLVGTDAEGDSLTFAEGATAETNGSVVVNSNGTFTFTPTAGFTGTATFSYKANDGSLNSTDATVTVTVTAANVAPVVNNVTLSTPLNTALTGTLAGSDADGDELTFAEGATAETQGTVVINSDGTFTFTPTNGFTGVATFSYRANDGSLNSSDATVTVNVTAANVAPVVNAVSLSTPISTALTGTLTGTDVDGDTLTFAEGATAETNGTVVINSNGTFTFTPTNGFTGVATFSYRANDGTVNSSDATVTVNVGTPNVAPIVVNGTGTATVNAALNGSLVSLATDVNGDDLSFAVGAQPANGSVTVNSNGTFTFTPDAGFVGTTSFTFTASDGNLTSNVGTFTVVVADIVVGDFELDLAESVSIGNSPSSPTALDPSVGLTNVATGTDFSNAQLTVSFVSGVDQKKDRLVVNKKDGNVRVKGKKILVDGTQVATVTSGHKKGSDLNISFNSSATQASVEAVMQRVAIQTRPSATGGVRVVQFELSADGSSDTATIAAALA